VKKEELLECTQACMQTIIFPSSIVLCNSLSSDIVLAPDIDSFKDKLEQSLLD